MKDIFGVIYVVVVLLAARYVLIDTATMNFRNLTKNEVVIFMLAIFVAMLGFMFITGRGFSKTPRPSKYHGQE